MTPQRRLVLCTVVALVVGAAVGRGCAVVRHSPRGVEFEEQIADEERREQERARCRKLLANVRGGLREKLDLDGDGRAEMVRVVEVRLTVTDDDLEYFGADRSMCPFISVQVFGDTPEGPELRLLEELSDDGVLKLGPIITLRGGRNALFVQCAAGQQYQSYCLVAKGDRLHLIATDFIPRRFGDIDRDGVEEVVAIADGEFVETLADAVRLLEWSEQEGDFVDEIRLPPLRELAPVVEHGAVVKAVAVDSQSRVHVLRYESKSASLRSVSSLQLSPIWPGIAMTAIEFSEVASVKGSRIFLVDEWFVEVADDDRLSLYPNQREMQELLDRGEAGLGPVDVP